MFRIKRTSKDGSTGWSKSSGYSQHFTISLHLLSCAPCPTPSPMTGNPQGLENTVLFTSTLLGPWHMVGIPRDFLSISSCFLCVPPRPPCHTLLTILLYIKGCLELLLGRALVTGFNAPGPKTEAQKVRRNGDLGGPPSLRPQGSQQGT